MAFKEVLDTNCETTISLGGVNKKTNQPNPTKIEGYYLGAKQVEDRKKKNGVSNIYAFQTPKGNVGVWGKTDLDRKMQSATPGLMTRVTQNGTRETPNGPMYTFKVEIDEANSIEVALPPSVAATSNEVKTFSFDDSEDSGLFDDESSALDESRPTRAKAPQDPVVTSSDRARALLKQARKTL